MYILIIGHSEEENRFCKTCGPVYTAEQLAQASKFYVQRNMGLPLDVKYVDANEMAVMERYVDIIRESRRQGLRFPLVFLVKDDDTYELLLHGSAEPYAIARALRDAMPELEQAHTP